MPWKLRVTYLALPACLALAAGCSSLDFNQSFSWPWEAEEEPSQPSRISAIWIDTVQLRANQPSLRGFGGRLMFYDRSEAKAVKVDGRLEVYAFEEDDAEVEKVKPDRKFIFPREQFAQHYSKSDLGHSYSFWLPFGDAAGEQKEISLIVRFIPHQGNPVVSEQTRHILPGQMPPPRREHVEVIKRFRQRQNATSNVRPALFETPGAAGRTGPETDSGSQRQMMTTTISVPPRFGLRPPVATVGARSSRNRATSRQATASPPGYPPQALPQGLPPVENVPPPQGFGPPQARFSPSTPRVPGGPADRSTGGRGPWQPRPVTSPFRDRRQSLQMREPLSPRSAQFGQQRPFPASPAASWGNQTPR